MTSRQSLNCERLRDSSEGRRAIYLEKGVLLVQVANIRFDVGARRIAAEINEVPTPGLEQSLFHHFRPNAPTPLRWSISAGYLTRFSDDIWLAGYGSWSLYFALEVVDSFINLASSWPPDLDAMGRYDSSIQFLNDASANKPCERVFPD